MAVSAKPATTATPAAPNTRLTMLRGNSCTRTTAGMIPPNTKGKANAVSPAPVGSSAVSGTTSSTGTFAPEASERPLATPVRVWAIGVPPAVAINT
ncbi:hypothetical protein EN35_36920 [Rhodococcus qingshengii]|nr:hypothetical protein EN35_36920 [Rhodococcus qingshengii]